MIYPLPTTHLTFFGGAKEVTGSCYRLAHKGVNLLLECGMLQRHDKAGKTGTEEFPFFPDEIDAVVISHAHLDHTGELPRLVAQGYQGPIYCTAGTLGLLRVLLPDACQIHQKDIEHENKHRQRAGEPLLTPDFDENDVNKVLSMCEVIPYYTDFTVEEVFTVRFDNAGHILGSAIVSITLLDEKGDRKLVFSGDLGNDDTALMPNPDTLETADWVMMEGTYGDRNHQPPQETLNELKRIIKTAEKQGGNILIPAFAIGRTQELIFELGKMFDEGLLKGWTVYLDSPMASKVTEFYARSQDEFDPQDIQVMEKHRQTNLLNFLPSLKVTDNVEDSIAINEQKHHAIIIAGSGMCTGGRIRHHFKHRLWDPANHVVFVGYQAQGTLGRILVNGVDRIKLFGQYIAGKEKIHTLGGFSAHADQTKLLSWAKHFKYKPPFYLVHGEPEVLKELRNQLKHQLSISAEIPAQGSTLYI